MKHQLKGGGFRKKRKEKKWKRKKKKKKKKNVKHRRSLWWTKRKAQLARPSVSERKEEEVKEKGAKQFSGKIWKMALPSHDLDAVSTLPIGEA